MKKFALLFFSLAFIQMAFAKTTVTGSVKGLRSGQAVISFRHPITMQESSWKAEINKGKFSISPSIEKPMFANLEIEDEFTSIYIVPNQNLRVSLNYKEFDESIEYSGDYAAENNFLKTYFLAFEDEGKNPTRNWYGDLESAEFKEKHTERLAAKLKLIDDFNAKTTLNDVFVGHWKNNNTYNTYGTLLYYPSIKAYYAKKPRAEVVHQGYYDFLNDCDFNNEQYLDQDGYLFFMGQYLSHKMAELQTNTSGGYSAENEFFMAQMIYKGKCRSAAQASILRNALSRIELKKIDPYWQDFIAECEPAVAEAMQLKYDKVVNLQPGKKAPQFTLVDIEGNNVNLSDFKGKVVYIDFWASWCGPCMQQVPYAKELQTQYVDNSNMVFLYISVDDDGKAWKKAVAEKELKGVHVWAKGFKHTTPQSYNITGIPTYYIIGKNGDIYKNNAPRPSSGAVLKDLLNKALAE
ncbi:MAG: TlpA family protein disulfide reductase [Bacteroidia bacterium]